MTDNRLFNALNGLDDSHFREDELRALEDIGSDRVKRKPFLKFRIMMTAAAVSAALGISITAGAAVTGGFTQGFITVSGSSWNHYPTLIFSAAGAAECPNTIEKFYMPAVLPENYRYHSYMGDAVTNYEPVYYRSTEDKNPLLDIDDLIFRQWTKDEFSRTYDVQKFVDVSEIAVNGCPGYLITSEHYYGTLCSVIWDNGDYILGVDCTLTAEEAVRIAESAVVVDNALDKEAEIEI